MEINIACFHVNFITPQTNWMQAKRKTIDSSIINIKSIQY